MCEVFSSLSVLCSVNVCVHPSFHPCPLWRFTQSSLLQVPSSHGAPPPQFAHHRDPPPSHRHTQRQAGVLSQWHRIPQQLVSSLFDFLLINQVGMHTLTSPPFHSQETSGCEKGGGKEEAATHKETSERVHALHEGNESQSGGRVHTERERSYQPDPRPKGERHTHPKRPKRYAKWQQTVSTTKTTDCSVVGGGKTLLIHFSISV